MFFDEIASALGKQQADTAKNLKSYAGKLAFGGTIVGAAGAALSAATGVPIGLVPIFAELLQKHGEAAKQASEVAELQGSQSLSDIKEALALEMAELRTPVLVVIDDIDRLTSPETALIFQMAKANADFPNFVYLLLYDQAVVAESLDQIVPGRGIEYLEKIVQLPITVPLPGPEQVREAWLRGLRELCGSLGLAEAPREEWFQELQEAFEKALFFYLANLRDVWRLLNALEFSLPLLVAQGHLDVDFSELVVLEVLRLQEPKFYEQLARHKEALVGSEQQAVQALRDAQRSRSGDSDPVAQRHLHHQEVELRQLVHLVAPENAPNRRPLLFLCRGLFPNAAWPDAELSSLHLPGHDLGINLNVSARWGHSSRLGVGDLQYFDRYFQLSLVSGSLLEAEVQSVMHSLDREELRAKFASLQASDQLFSLLGRVFTAVREPGAFCSSEFLAVLLEQGEVTGHARAEDFNGFDVSVRILRASFQHREFAEQERSDLFKRIFEMSNGILCPMWCLLWARGALNSTRSLGVLKTTLVECERIVLSRIENSAREGRLQEHPCVERLMLFWARQNQDAARTWMQSIESDTPKVIQILDAWAFYIFQAGVVWTEQALHLFLVFPWERLRPWLESVNRSQLSTEQVRVLQEYEAQIPRFDFAAQPPTVDAADEGSEQSSE